MRFCQLQLRLLLRPVCAIGEWRTRKINVFFSRVKTRKTHSKSDEKFLKSHRRYWRNIFARFIARAGFLVEIMSPEKSLAFVEREEG